MNKSNIKEIFLEYFKTFILTMLISFIIVLIMLKIFQHKVYKEEMYSHSAITTEKVDSSNFVSIDTLIQKNKYLEVKYPNDYRINSKLGRLYEAKSMYKEAEVEYQQAISKAPYDEFRPTHELARLYIRLGLLDNAQSLMDKIQDKPNKRLIRYKSNIYKELGDAYYAEAKYKESIDRYKKSLLYAKILKKKKEITYLKNSLASAYVYQAEDDLNNMEPNYAIDSLKKAIKIVNAPILQYKLGFLLMSKEPKLAYKYLNEVFNEEPDIINYEKYSKFLTELADKADTDGYPSQAGLYRYKMKRLKEYFTTNVLSVNDVAIDDLDGQISFNRHKKRYDISLEFRIRNTSRSNINSLYTSVVFRDNDSRGAIIAEENHRQIVNKKSMLGIELDTPLIIIKAHNKNNINKKKLRIVIAEIYISKAEKSQKILLKTIKFKEVIKKRHINKYVLKFMILFQKLMSKLPAFMF